MEDLNPIKKIEEKKEKKLKLKDIFETKKQPKTNNKTTKKKKRSNSY